MNKLRKIINIVTYVLLMFIGGIIFVGFIALGAIILTATTPYINDFINWLNETFGTNLEESFKQTLLILGSIPFVFMSLNGIAIILLTQRITTVKKTIKVDMKKKVTKKVKKEVGQNQKENEKTISKITEEQNKKIQKVEKNIKKSSDAKQTSK